MATLRELEAAEAVFKIDPELPQAKQEVRLIHASERVLRWVADTLPTLPSALGLELNPAEQLLVLVEEFCSGENLLVGPGLHCMAPAGAGVWVLKTPELRLYGWFHARDCFIAVVIDTKDRIVKHNLYHGYVGEVVRFRDALDLDEPKFVEGESPYDVVSNYSYP